MTAGRCNRSSDGSLTRRRRCRRTLAGALEKPLLVEGPAGVGKTDLAKALAARTYAELVRLHCYEGLDVSQAAARAASTC